jgi:hypothetical protein
MQKIHKILTRQRHFVAEPIFFQSFGSLTACPAGIPILQLALKRRQHVLFSPPPSAAGRTWKPEHLAALITKRIHLPDKPARGLITIAKP